MKKFAIVETIAYENRAGIQSIILIGPFDNREDADTYMKLLEETNTDKRVEYHVQSMNPV